MELVHSPLFLHTLHSWKTFGFKMRLVITPSLLESTNNFSKRSGVSQISTTFLSRVAPPTSSGPVVIFNVDETRCDALALIYGIREPLHITLENFSLVQAEQLQKALQSNLLEQRDAGDGERAGHRARTNITLMEFVLKELWYKVIHPVLKALGYSVSSVDH